MASTTCAMCGATCSLKRLGGLCPRCAGRRLLGPTPERTHVTTESIGDRLGRYRLVERLGEGGGGVVYAADQEEPVRRRVALKIVKLGMDTHGVIRRFEAERQALALMSHPGIARVYDAGTTETGRPYFVMELVPGSRITCYCKELALDVRARVELFIQVCHAVQHAHQKGIIHRDLKPSNILVVEENGRPVPKVIDFGIAKAVDEPLIDDTQITEMHQRLGTPAYMSPEQIQGGPIDIDTRSDIYALGILLYELLAGVTPFDVNNLLKEGPDALRRVICNEEPVRPSKRLAQRMESERCESRLLPCQGPIASDLDWIVLKCLRKDRARRYDTASSLAQDLRHHLDDEPVTAVAPTFGYQATKLFRRHRIPLTAAAILVAVLIIASAWSGWMAVRATRAEKMASDRLRESEIAREESEAVSTFVTEILRSPNPAEGDRDRTLVQMLDHTVQKLATDTAISAARRVRFEVELGMTYRSLGLHREAIAILEKAKDYYVHTLGLEHTNTLSTMGALAGAYHDASRKTEALDISKRVAEARERLQGENHPHTLRSRSHLAWMLHVVGQVSHAIRIEEQVLERSRRVNGADHPDTVEAMSYLGWFYSQGNRPQDGLPLLVRALTLVRERSGPEHPSTLSVMTSLAVTHTLLGQTDEAAHLLQQVLALSKKVKGPGHPETIWAMAALADAHRVANQLESARRGYQDVLALSLQVNGAEHARTRWARGKLAELGRMRSETNTAPFDFEFDVLGQAGPQ